MPSAVARSLLIVLLVVTTSCLCWADEVATGRYRDLCRPLGMKVGGGGATAGGKATFIVSTSQPGVKPRDIRLTLKTPDETVPIPVAADGVVALPINQKLFDADAIVVSNVPKGTLRIRGLMLVQGEKPLSELCTPVSPHLADGVISYADLVQLARTHRLEVLKALAEEKVGEPIDPASVVPERLNDTWVIVLWAREDADTADATLIEKGPQPQLGVLGRLRKNLTGQKSQLQKVADGVFMITCSEAMADENPLVSLTMNESWSCAILTADQIKKIK